jgi:hypothetical protein
MGEGFSGADKGFDRCEFSYHHLACLHVHTDFNSLSYQDGGRGGS